ncbi:MAG: hypothetical protein MHMPM18_002391 [Marteilia pararefringens]
MINRILRQQQHYRHRTILSQLDYTRRSGLVALGDSGAHCSLSKRFISLTGSGRYVSLKSSMTQPKRFKFTIPDDNTTTKEIMEKFNWSMDRIRKCNNETYEEGYRKRHKKNTQDMILAFLFFFFTMSVFFGMGIHRGYYVGLDYKVDPDLLFLKEKAEEARLAALENPEQGQKE